MEDYIYIYICEFILNNLYLILCLLILNLVYLLQKSNKYRNINGNIYIENENTKLSLKNILEDIINEKIKIPHAYIHPLNFIRIVLKKFDDGSQLRLHIWLGKSEEETPHDHRFNFKSYVLDGAITNINYYTIKDNNGKYKMYETKFNKNGELEYENNNNYYNIEICDKFTINKNEVYNLNCNIIHNSIINNSNTNTITLLYQSSIIKDKTLILKNKKDYENKKLENSLHNLSQKEIIQNIKELYIKICEKKIENIDIDKFCKL